MALSLTERLQKYTRTTRLTRRIWSLSMEKGILPIHIFEYTYTKAMLLQMLHQLDNMVITVQRLSNGMFEVQMFGRFIKGPQQFVPIDVKFVNKQFCAAVTHCIIKYLTHRK